MSQNGSKNLKLVPQKTEAVVLLAGRKVKSISVTVESITTQSQEVVRYLGIKLDRNMSMRAHARAVTEKGNKALNNISRLLPKVNGPLENTRAILCSVVTSILPYGASISEQVIEKKVYKRILSSVRRKVAIRVSGADRTNSKKALIVIARIPPTNLLVKCRARIQKDGPETKKEAQNTLMLCWQEEWDRDDGTAEWIDQLGNGDVLLAVKCSMLSGDWVRSKTDPIPRARPAMGL
ncbi:uncharacterized protein LOC132701437 [Cylas formicarius]|uniref:uncharacterized protein LOC132701437 n=1 Tax=Cylas formicarius TaxID=197179 RepID=UPI002958CF49|nr:uncharacterized protein LOC132701437 [Cylas formicarius]